MPGFLYALTDHFKGATLTRSRFPAEFAVRVCGKPLDPIIQMGNVYRKRHPAFYPGETFVQVPRTRKLPRFAPPREGGTLLRHIFDFPRGGTIGGFCPFGGIPYNGPQV